MADLTATVALTLVTLHLVLVVTQGQELEGYDCRNPSEAKFYRHDDCNLHNTNLRTEDYFIVQNNARRNMTAHRCELHVTTIVGYCGHYSATKVTDESSYHVPTRVTSEICRQAANEGVLVWGGHEHQISQEKITMIDYFTHGALDWSSTNVACTGETMRRKDGSVTANLMRRVQLQFRIQTIQTMTINEAVSTMGGKQLGPYRQSYGQDGMATVVWNAPEKLCNLGVVGKMPLTTTNSREYYNHDHLVQLTRGITSYDVNCGQSYVKTDLDGIYLIRAERGIKLAKMNINSLDFNAQMQTQINYLSSEVSQKFGRQYKKRHDPDCRDIMNSPLHETVKIDSNSFLRNLGDVSVKFECQPVRVHAMNNTDKCYKAVPVTDNSGKPWFLEPESKILVEKSSETYCSVANVPIVRGVDRNYYAFDPTPRQVVITTISNEIPSSDDPRQKGIYAEETIKQWLDNAYLNSYAEHLAVAYNVKGENGDTVYDAAEALHRTYELAKKIDIEGWLLGLNWDRIGGRCSIAVVSAMASYLLYGIAMFVSKAMIIYGGGDFNVAVSALKAAFSQIYLLTEAIKRKRGENQTAEAIGTNDTERGEVTTRDSTKLKKEKLDPEKKMTRETEQQEVG